MTAPPPLTLTMLAWPEGGRPESRQIADRCRLGRGHEDADWALADPGKAISRLHCEIFPFDGRWQVMDRSLNGTFLDDDPRPIGNGQIRDLTDGSRLRIGEYRFEARLTSSPQLDPDRAHGIADGAASPPWPLDPLRRREPPPPVTEPAEPPGLFSAFPGGLGGFEPEPVANAPADILAALIRGGTATNPVPPAGGEPPGLGADWALPREPDPAAARSTGAASGALGADWNQPRPPAGPQDGALGADWNQPRPPAGPQDGALGADWNQPRPPAPLPGGAPPDIPRPDARPDGEAAALLAAFRRGAGLDSDPGPDPLRQMELAGIALRALVTNLQQVRDTRSEIRRAFRIAEMTSFAAAQRNPLRMVLEPGDALRALLNGRIDPAEAIGEALRQSGLHDLALVRAMREAAEDLIDSLSPAEVEAATGQPSEGGMLTDLRRARAWKAYQGLHAQIRDALHDDFDSVFGKAFARAYERALTDAENAAGRSASGQAATDQGDRHR
ncbi:MAG: hypothetical protein RLZZ501_1166 [Pseudomonadota bacterium]